MADNVTLPGTGDVVATDDIAGKHYQYMKLVDGTADSTNAAVVDADGRLNVTNSEKYIAPESVTGGNVSSTLDVLSYTLARIEIDTGNSGIQPYFEVSPNGTTGWRAAPAMHAAGLGGMAPPILNNTSGQIRWIDVTGFAGLRLNNAGTATCTFNATLISVPVGAVDQGKSGQFTVTGLNDSSGPITTNGASMLAFYQPGGNYVVTVRGSWDGVNWWTLPNTRFNTAWAPSAFSSTGATASGTLGFYQAPTRGMPYVKFDCTTYTSGGNTINWTLSNADYVDHQATSIGNQGINWVVQGTVTASNVTGNIASGSADSGNPVKIGGIATTGQEATVINARRINTRHDATGRLVMRPYQHRERVTSAAVTLTNTTDETTLLAAQGASVFADLSSISLFNSSATTVNVTLRSVTAGSTDAIYTVPAGGGVVVPLPVQLKQATANSAWTVQSSGAVNAIHVNAVFTLEL